MINFYSLLMQTNIWELLSSNWLILLNKFVCKEVKKIVPQNFCLDGKFRPQILCATDQEKPMFSRFCCAQTLCPNFDLLFTSTKFVGQPILTISSLQIFDCGKLFSPQIKSGPKYCFINPKSLLQEAERTVDRGFGFSSNLFT